MAAQALHRFEHGGKRYAVDPETCFCFECDAISWDVLEHYPQASEKRIAHLLAGKHHAAEIREVISELEWLRSSKSILPSRGLEEQRKEFDLERGLKRLSIALSDSMDAAEQTVREGIEFLLARAGSQENLGLEFRLGAGQAPQPQALKAYCALAWRRAALASKTISVSVRAALGGQSGLGAHGLALRLEIGAGAGAGQDKVFALLSQPIDPEPKKLAKQLNSLEGRATVVINPSAPDFADAVAELERAGCNAIEIDLDAAFAQHPGCGPAAMLEELQAATEYYAQRLAAQRYFLLEPIASYFQRIYEGKAIGRLDPAGAHALFIGPEGAINPAPFLNSAAEFNLGSLAAGVLEEERLGRFDDIGAATTPACQSCWARGLCGGGSATIHHALTGSFRQPDSHWCEAQRRFLETAIVSFNLLAAQGVNFTRLYHGFSTAPKRSVFSMARTLFQTTLGLRPTGEADAELLNAWENWNDAAYFTCQESGMRMSTRYDREMDALHPRTYQQEFLLTSRQGAPVGLLRIRPEQRKGAAQAWLYLHRKADLESKQVRKSFQGLLREIGAREALQSVTVPVGPEEDPLAALLESAGFTHAGTQREALYLHGRYHDVRVYAFAF